jgi:hypothetical protein
MVVVIAGTIGDGFSVWGPFNDFDEANEWAERECGDEWWVVQINEVI